MSKSAITAEQLETMLTSILTRVVPEILTKVMDRFDKIVDKFTEKVDRLQGELHDTNVRVDEISKTLTDLQKSVSGSYSSAVSTSAPSTGSSASTVQVMLAVEAEKAERIKRQHNIVISGLSEQHGVADEELFLKLCEENLDVKPKPTQCMRIGGQSGDQLSRKLRVTLDAEHTVDDMISASMALRKSSNPALRQIYFNRDLTKMQAQTAYETRQLRRSAARNTTETTVKLLP